MAKSSDRSGTKRAKVVGSGVTAIAVEINPKTMINIIFFFFIAFYCSELLLSSFAKILLGSNHYSTILTFNGKASISAVFFFYWQDRQFEVPFPATRRYIFW